MRNDREWLVPLTGVLFIVLLIVGFVVGGEPPEADDPVREIVEHYTDDKDSIMLGALIGGLAIVALIFFMGYLRTVLRAADGGRSMLPSLVLVGTTIVATGAAIDGTISIALAEAADDIDPAAVQALQALWDNDWLPFAVGSMVLLLSAGIAIVKTGALPRWLGWVAIVLAILEATPAGFFAFIGVAVWILIVSVMLAVRARRTPAAPAAPAV